MEFEKIRGIIAEQMNLDADKITLETAFADLGADSLDLFQIISELEEEFGMEFDMSAADKIKTVADAVSFVQEAKE